MVRTKINAGGIFAFESRLYIYRLHEVLLSAGVFSLLVPHLQNRADVATLTKVRVGMTSMKHSECLAHRKHSINVSR